MLTFNWSSFRGASSIRDPSTTKSLDNKQERTQKAHFGLSTAFAKAMASLRRARKRHSIALVVAILDES
jgi:hypothetical protein